MGRIAFAAYKSEEDANDCSQRDEVEKGASDCLAAGWNRARRCLTRACSRRANLARGAARAAPSVSAAKEAQVCVGSGTMARS